MLYVSIRKPKTEAMPEKKQIISSIFPAIYDQYGIDSIDT